MSKSFRFSINSAKMKTTHSLVLNNAKERKEAMETQDVSQREEEYQIKDVTQKKETK